MKKHLLHFIILGLLTIETVAAFIVRGKFAFEGITWGTLPRKEIVPVVRQEPTPVATLQKVKFGVYDPRGLFNSINTISYDHFFIDWDNYDKNKLLAWSNSSTRDNRWPMVTVEPWTGYFEASSESSVLEDITKGTDDKKITKLCSDLNEYGNPILIRFAHEMDHDIGRYPWAVNNEKLYINAYQHFVDVCKKSSDNFYYVWSPIGNSNLSLYWPGTDYVDFIGLSVYSYPTYDMDNYGYIRDFNELFKSKYDLVKDYQKPVIIAEMGVSGTDDYKERWFENAVNSFSKYPLLHSVFYFEAKELDTKAWGEKYTLPNWKVSKETFEMIIEKYMALDMGK